ncbi:MAG: ABC transporter permease subunit [Candidatus Nanoperiomorbaceae bacterium]
MPRTIFGKTLYEKRWTILLWFGAALVCNLGIALLFPPIRDSMSTMIGSVPKSMAGWFGTGATWSTFTGYTGQELFGEMTLLLMAAAILFGAAFGAGDENNRTLLAVLARPVNRLSFYVQKYLALLAFLVFVTVGFSLGILLGGWFLSESMPFGKFAECLFIVFLHVLALGSITFALGAATGRRALAGMIVGSYTFIAYFISSLSTAADVVKKLSYATLFRYAKASDVLAKGLNGSHILILVLAIVVPLLIAAPIFRRRDLKTR